MPSLEVIRFRDIVAATHVDLVPDLLPITVALTGEDFTSAETVQINDIEVPTFIIVNKTTIWAEIPANTGSIDSVSVLSSKFTKTATASLVQFQVGNQTRLTSGVLKLSQLFIKWLLQSPGSDIFNPERGGGVQALIGSTIASGNLNPVLAGLTHSISKTEAEIQEAQLSGDALPLAERLLSATILDLKVIDVLMEARVRIRVMSMTGEDAISSVAL